MRKKQSKFSCGACYYPLYFPENDWESDILKMKRTGLNFTRTAELLASWDRIEKKEGRYDFFWLDSFMDLCAKHGIKIILGTGTASPPHWLRRKYKDISVKNRDKIECSSLGMWNWACPNHPGFLSEAKRYIELITRRYKDHSSLFAWQIGNEIGYPFVPKQGCKYPEIYGYHKYTVRKFQSWLRNKYRNIDELNKAWMWTPTNICFNSWDSVDAPVSLPVEWGNLTAWCDWREFCAENMANYIGWQVKIVKTFDSIHPTCVNIFFIPESDPFGMIISMDPWRLIKVVDALGIDIYPTLRKRWYRQPEYSSLFLDLALSVAAHKKKPLWITELQSGPIGGWVTGPEGRGNGEEINKAFFDCVSHKSELILFMGWRDFPQVPLYWGGLVDLKGNLTERSKKLKESLNLINKNYSFFQGAEPIKNEISIYLGDKNRIFVTAIERQDFLLESIRGIYQILWRKGFSVDFLNDEDMMSLNARKGTKVIFAPAAFCFSDKISQKILNFVREGGILFAGPQIGFVDEKYNRRNEAPEDILRVLGIKNLEILTEENPKILLVKEKKVISGYHHKVYFKPSREISILGRYVGEESPAISESSFGKGRAFFVGTHLENAWIQSENENIEDFYYQILKKLNIFPPIECIPEKKDEKTPNFDIHLLKSKNVFIIIFINLNNWKGKVKLVIKYIEINSLKELESGKEVNYKKEKSQIFIPLILSGKGVEIFIAS